MLEMHEIPQVIYLPLSVLPSYYRQIVSTWYSMLFYGRLAFWQQLRGATDLKLVERSASERKNIMLPLRSKQLVFVTFHIFVVVSLVVATNNFCASVFETQVGK